MRWEKIRKKRKEEKKKRKKIFTIKYSLNRLCSNWLKFQFDQRKKISRPERVKTITWAYKSKITITIS